MIDDDQLKAQQLQAWLTTLNLPPRVINPLRRDLEVVLGEREGVAGKSGGLAGVSREQFVAELYRAEGGVIRQLPAVGALVIEALREAIPPTRAASAGPAAPPQANDGWRTFELNDASEPAKAPTPQTVAAPAPPARPAPLSRADNSAATAEQPPAPIKRRGRPRKIGAPTPEPAPQRHLQASAATAPAARTAEPVTPEVVPIEPKIVVEPDEMQLRQLWRELHPQGRRAVLGYISELLIR